MEGLLSTWPTPLGISLAPSASQTKQTVQQGKLCWHCVLDCGLGPRLVSRTVKKNRQPGLTVFRQKQSSSSSNVNKTVHFKQCNTAAKTWTFYTTFTQLLPAYTGEHYTWCDNILQNNLKLYSGRIRTSQEATENIMKHKKSSWSIRKVKETPDQTGRPASVGGQTLRGEQTRQGDQAGQGDNLGFEGRLYRKSRRDRDSKLNRDISLGWEGGPPRESRLSRETSLWWEGRLCRESWLGIAYSNKCSYNFDPTSPPPKLHDASWSFLVLFEACLESWLLLPIFLFVSL